jgi:hypothetical protein
VLPWKLRQMLGSKYFCSGIVASAYIFFLWSFWWVLWMGMVNVVLNPFTASCENAMTLSVPGVPASCEKFPHSSQLNFWSTESIFNQFSMFLKTLNALCACLQH